MVACRGSTPARERGAYRREEPTLPRTQLAPHRSVAVSADTLKTTTPARGPVCVGMRRMSTAYCRGRGRRRGKGFGQGFTIHARPAGRNRAAADSRPRLCVPTSASATSAWPRTLQRLSRARECSGTWRARIAGRTPPREPAASEPSRARGPARVTPGTERGREKKASSAASRVARAWSVAISEVSGPPATPWGSSPGCRC